MTVANAGHPAPVLVAGDQARFVEMPVGVPLGAGAGPYDSVTFSMPLGSTLLAYTDGLVERRGEDIEEGLQRLSRTALRVAVGPLDRVIADVLAAVEAADSSDDIAILALRRVDA